MEEEELIRQQQNRMVKEQLKAGVEANKKQLEEKIKSQVSYVKQEKMDQKDFLHIQKQQEYLKNSSMKQMIKSQQKEAQEKKQRDLMEKQART